MHSAQADTKAGPKGRRRVAGEDPAKRNQILDGARRCFLSVGFAHASMNQITAEAGVSKGTIYVYFADKEGLFKALIEREKSKGMSAAQETLDKGGTIPEVLHRFGTSISTRMTSDEMVRAQRMVLGVIEQMPEIAQIFYGGDTFSAHRILARYLDTKTASGELVIANTDLAARQFLDLSMASNFKRRLFGNLPEPMPASEIESIVSSAVTMFLAVYGPQQTAPRTTPHLGVSETASG